MEKYPISILKYAVIVISISSFFYTIQIYLFIKDIINKIQITITFSLIFFLCFIYDTGSDQKSHGSYNRIVLLFGIVFMLTLYYIFSILIKTLIKYPIPVIIILILLGFYTNYKLKLFFLNSCGNWSQGFHDTKIDNSEGDCKIYPPQTCYFEIFHGVFDVSRIFSETCENTPYNNPYNTINNIKDKTTKILGFPRSEKWKFFPDSNFGYITKTAMKNVINMEDKNISDDIKKNIEVTVNYYKNPPEVAIDLKVNENLIKERRKTFGTFFNKVLNKNILYVFIDSLSRVNFRRKLPKLYSWIESKHHK